MGCGSSNIQPAGTRVNISTERRCSQVTIESQQRTVAAYRRQRFARDLEQDTYLRAEAEVEKALMLKRSSVDERRPSYILRALQDLEEIEEGQEETEENHPKIMVDSCSDADIKHNNDNTAAEYFTNEHDYHSNTTEHFANKVEDHKNTPEDHAAELEHLEQNTNKNDVDTNEPNHHIVGDDHISEPELFLERPDQHTNEADYHTNEADHHTNEAKRNTDKAEQNTNEADQNTNEADHHTNEAEQNMNKAERHTKEAEHNTNNVLNTSLQGEDEKPNDNITTINERVREYEGNMKETKPSSQNAQQEISGNKHEQSETPETKHGSEINELNEREMKNGNAKNENSINENLEQGTLNHQDAENNKLTQG